MTRPVPMSLEANVSNERFLHTFLNKKSKMCISEKYLKSYLEKTLRLMDFYCLKQETRASFQRQIFT